MAWNGSDQTSPVDAASRRVKGGSTNSSSTRRVSASTGGGKSGTKHGLLALLLIAALGGAAIWYFTRPVEKPVATKETKKPSKIASVTPAPARTNKVAVAPAPRPPTREERRAAAMALQRAAMAKKLGRRKVHGIVTNTSNTADAPVHKNATEQIMVMVFGTELGDMPLPLPDIPERDRKRMAEILISENNPTEKDTEDQKLDREIIAQAKQMLKDYIKEGGDVDSFFSYYHNELEKAYRERTDARKMVLETARNGEPEMARELLDKYNEHLAAKGIKQINLSDKAFKVKERKQQ